MQLLFLQDKNGKSPLQMLAQTCSQIGADSGSNKLLAEKMNARGSVSPKGSLPSASNGSSSTNNNSLKRKSVSPALIVTDHKTPRTSPPSSRSSAVNFKPYETSPEKKKSGSSVISLSPPLAATAPSPKSDKRGNKSPPQHKSHKVEQMKSSDHHSSFSRLTDHHHTTNPAFRYT